MKYTPQVNYYISKVICRKKDSQYEDVMAEMKHKNLEADESWLEVCY